MMLQAKKAPSGNEERLPGRALLPAKLPLIYLLDLS